MTWNYTAGSGTVTVVGPNETTIVSSSPAAGTEWSGITSGLPCGASQYSYGLVTNINDPLLRNTAYQYSGLQVQQVTLPEGNGMVYTYDDRANLTAITRKRKPGSTDVTDNVVVFQAGYDVTPSGYESRCLAAKRTTCNQPNWTRDARGSQTDYVYESHGAPKMVTAPADQNDLRMRTYYSYETYTGTTPSIYRLTRTETCGLSSSQLSLLACPAVASTAVTVTSYGTSTTAPNTYNTFLPYSVTQTDGAGSLSATTTNTYDAWGRVTAVDGPLPGTGDTAYTTYDLVGRKVCEIGVDPDGGGALVRVMVRHSYNNDDKETLTQTGTGTSTTDCTPVTSMTVSSFTRMTYDNLGRLTKTEVGQP